MGFFVLALFSLLFSTCFGHTSDRHMICKDVGDLTSTDIQARPGAVGGQWSKGEKGSPDEVNEERLQEIVRSRVKEETRELQAKVDKMDEQIQKLTLSVMCYDGVRYGGRCFWAEVHSSRDTTIAEAQEICAKKGSRLADIYGKTHYDEIMVYLRGKLSGRSYIHVWTGMKKIYGNNIAQLSNGTPASYTRQHSGRLGWEDAERRRTHVYLKVMSSTSDTDNGLGALWPEYRFSGSLCQSE